ncbi:MAG: hypothetical protein JWQ35_2274 [Bacteriovoracaceae bacterium]|nr:hypothetical protein [Bacteriovoracaceae bacterium]
MNKLLVTLVLSFSFSSQIFAASDLTTRSEIFKALRAIATRTSCKKNGLFQNLSYLNAAGLYVKSIELTKSVRGSSIIRSATTSIESYKLVLAELGTGIDFEKVEMNDCAFDIPEGLSLQDINVQGIANLFLK